MTPRGEPVFSERKSEKLEDRSNRERKYAIETDRCVRSLDPVLRTVTGVCLYDSHSVKNVPGVWTGGELSSRKRPSWHLNSDLCSDPREERGASEDMPVSQRDSYNTAGAKNILTDTHKETIHGIVMQAQIHILNAYETYRNNTHTHPGNWWNMWGMLDSFPFMCTCVCKSVYPHRVTNYINLWLFS